MKYFKNIFCFLLIFTLSLLLCGCSLLEITTTITRTPATSTPSSDNKSSSKDKSSKPVSSSKNSSSTASSDETYSKIENAAPHDFIYSTGVTAYGYYNIGSCKKLVGDVYTLVIFLDDDESKWTASARNAFYKNRFTPSATYIQNQAKLRDVDLSFNFGKYSVTSDQNAQPRYDGIVSSSAENAIDNLDILNKAALSIGFTNKDVMHAYLKNYTGTDQIAYLLVLNKPGRAYAVVDTTYNDIDSIEFVVAFSSNEKGEAAVGSSVVHELLHLFGAADLYGHSKKYPDREKLCSKLYPNDIMRKSATDPSTLSIGRLTECLIGWSDYFPPECDCKEWWNKAFEETHRPHYSQPTSSAN